MQTNISSKAIRITLVEDNAILRTELINQLQYVGYDVKGVEDAIELDVLLQNWPSHIYILDVNLPGENGFSIAQRLNNPSQHGIILLTARSDINDKINGLEQGADLYLTKPIDWRELNACIKSLYRRLMPEITAPNWTLNLSNRCLTSKSGKSLGLSTQDIIILEALLKKSGQIISRNELATILDFTTLNRSDYRINVIIFRLRQKLATFDTEFTIHTWRSDGYSLIAPTIHIQDPYQTDIHSKTATSSF